MRYDKQTHKLNNNKKITLRSPIFEDTLPLIDYLKTVTDETAFLLSHPSEITYTEFEEWQIIKSYLESKDKLMVLAIDQDKIVGNCTLSFKTKLKNKHRAMVGLSIIKSHWSLGLGSLLMDLMIDFCRESGIKQLELEVFSSNLRAISLYERKGFIKTGEIPNAIKLEDGSYINEIYMIKQL